jgi:hypothetical protein
MRQVSGMQTQTAARLGNQNVDGVKNKWDNDVEKYIMAYGTQEWADKMGIAKKKAEAEKPAEKSEVKE